MNSALLALALLSAPAPADTIVVCPAAFQEAIAPWVEYRRAQGRNVVVVPAGSAEEIRAEIRRIAQSGALRFVVLAGDSMPPRPPRINPDAVPTYFAKAKVNVLWGSEPEIATDNWYADLDDDQIPDVAVGRLPADSPSELDGMVRKIVAYEHWQSAGRWRGRLNFVAGSSGAGAIADAALETVAKNLLTEHIPARYSTTMTYGSWRSPYCPDPEGFQATVVERLQEGCLFWVYLGHGQRTFLDYVHMPEGMYPILSTQDAARLHGNNAPAIALMLACYTGAFDGPQDCLAEEMLRSSGGPVAVVASSRVTMPYAMTVLGTQMLTEYFGQHPATLGEMLLASKRNSLLKPRTDPKSQMLDAMAASLNPRQSDLVAERTEHVLLFNLLGDPLLKLDYPEAMQVTASSSAAAGTTLSVSGSSPIDGEAEIELVVRRDRLTFRPQPRSNYDGSPKGRAGLQQTYDQANDKRLTAGRVTIQNGSFQTTLTIPTTAVGDCHVRVFVQAGNRCALGAANVLVNAAAQPAATTAARATATPIRLPR